MRFRASVFGNSSVGSTDLLRQSLPKDPKPTCKANGTSKTDRDSRAAKLACSLSTGDVEITIQGVYGPYVPLLHTKNQ